MTKASLWAILLAFLTSVFCSCTDGDDMLFNEGSSQYITIEAFISESLDSSTVKSKADTIRPGDSLIFMAMVSPSKTIRVKTYYWTLDEKKVFVDFNTKMPIYDPGIHQVKFFLVDYFGDTLSDSLSVVVATPPQLSLNNFIPADGIQNITPQKYVNFTWDAKDPDNLWDLSYQFTLREGANERGEILVDTILDQPYFTYYGGLSPLSVYQWTVSVENEVHQKDTNVIRSKLSTKGVDGENAIFGYAKLDVNEISARVHQVLKDKDDKIVYDDFVSLNRGFSSFHIKPIPEGTYKLLTSIESLTDFGTDTTTLDLKGNQVFYLDTIIFVDSIPPVIRALDGRDTLNYADTIKILVTDKGGDVPHNRFKAQLEKELILTSRLEKDTMYISIPSLKESWTYRLLTITVYDNSGNRSVKTFYIAPSVDFSEVFLE